MVRGLRFRDMDGEEPNERIIIVAPLRYRASYISPEAQWACSLFRKSRWGHQFLLFIFSYPIHRLNLFIPLSLSGELDTLADGWGSSSAGCGAPLQICQNADGLHAWYKRED
jgi:hypothetical protein